MTCSGPSCIAWRGGYRVVKSILIAMEGPRPSSRSPRSCCCCCRRLGLHLCLESGWVESRESLGEGDAMEDKIPPELGRTQG